MDGTLYWIVAVIAAIFVGLGKGGVPVITALAVPLMSLVMSPVLAAGLLLPVFIVSDVFGLMAYRRHFSRDVLKIMMVVMPLGVLIGYLTVDLVSEAMVTLILGVIGSIFALSLMLRRASDSPPQPARWARGFFWGTITGFTSFVSHSGSVPYQVYVLPLKLDKITFAGTVTVAFAYINIVKLIPYFLLGQLSLANMQTALILVGPAIASVFAGVWLVRIIPEKLFFRIIVWALLLLSMQLIWQSLRGLT